LSREAARRSRPRPNIGFECRRRKVQKPSNLVGVEDDESLMLLGHGAGLLLDVAIASTRDCLNVAFELIDALLSVAGISDQLEQQLMRPEVVGAGGLVLPRAPPASLPHQQARHRVFAAPAPAPSNSRRHFARRSADSLRRWVPFSKSSSTTRTLSTGSVSASSSESEWVVTNTGAFAAICANSHPTRTTSDATQFPEGTATFDHAIGELIEERVAVAPPDEDAFSARSVLVPLHRDAMGRVLARDADRQRLDELGADVLEANQTHACDGLARLELWPER